MTEEEITQRWGASRPNVEMRQYLVKAEAHRAQLVADRQALGGTPGIAVAKTLVPLLWKTEPTDADSDTMFDQLTLHNPRLTLGMGQKLFNVAINDPTHGESFVNQVLGEEFGLDHEGKPFTLAYLRELLDWDKAGLINRTYFRGEVGKDGPVSERERKMEQRLAAIEGSETKRTQQDAATRQRQEIERVGKAFDFVSNFLMSPVLALAEKSGWAVGDNEVGPDGKPTTPEAERKMYLGDMLSSHIDKRMKASDEWKEIRNLVRQGRAFDQAGKATPALDVYLEPLAIRTTAWFREAQRIVNPGFAKAAASTRNAQLATKNGNNGADQGQQIPPVAQPRKPTDRPVSVSEEMDRLFDEFRARELDATTPVGTR